jgi:hypothetical protein
VVCKKLDVIDLFSIVYDPKRGDNESESAVLFNEFAMEVSLVCPEQVFSFLLLCQSNDITTTVQHFINCTKSHTEVQIGNKELDYFLGNCTAICTII